MIRTMAAKSLFAATNLTCLRGERLVFTQLEFALGPGQALILRGPNGSGKSSLLRLLAGLSRPEAGAITWGGKDIAEDAAAHRSRLHFIGHLDGIKPALNVSETLIFWAGMRDKSGTIDDALARFRLTRLAPLPCRYLSAGERKRLALSRLIATPAELWLLDEPTSGLDAAAEIDLLQALAEHRESGGRAIIATHGPLPLEDAGTLSLDDYTPRTRAKAA
jgi:heme exporter protein A